MLAHARVLEAALAQHTVLPMRFGVVMENDDVRQRLLGSHGEELRAQLRELAGKVEMNVRVLYEEAALMREIVTANREIATLRERIHGQPDELTYYERIQLGELVADAVERRRKADAEGLLQALSAACLAAEVAEPGHERVALNASFLVSREGVARFDETLDRLAGEHASLMRFKCVGPLPPHSFVDLSQAV